MEKSTGASAVRRPLLSILSCDSRENLVSIVYRCSCSTTTAHIHCYRNEHKFILVHPDSGSIPDVEATWVTEVVRIKCTCACGTGCLFTRDEDDGSVLVEVFT